MYVCGGGNGSAFINELIGTNLEALTEDYVVVHQVGKAHLSKWRARESKNYIPVGFLAGDEHPELLKRADMVISRAGAGLVSEIISLRKRCAFIPLRIAQKNEQYFNALEALPQTPSVIITEDLAVKPGFLLQKLSALMSIKDYQHSNNIKKTKICPRELIAKKILAAVAA
jgi:UDP-N-acetylglucosamine--N-acetylmuramyl-(pentapeptide) pyrophosphoryl-undecaprenol N-acetylglucosamine transferase